MQTTSCSIIYMNETILSTPPLEATRLLHFSTPCLNVKLRHMNLLYLCHRTSSSARSAWRWDSSAPKSTTFLCPWRWIWKQRQSRRSKAPSIANLRRLYQHRRTPRGVTKRETHTTHKDTTSRRVRCTSIVTRTNTLGGPQGEREGAVHTVPPCLHLGCCRRTRAPCRWGRGCIRLWLSSSPSISPKTPCPCIRFSGRPSSFWNRNCC